MRARTMTDYRIDLDRWQAPPEHRLPGLVFILGPTWTMAAEALCRAGFAPCPACRGGPLRPKEYCLVCDRCGFDNVLSWPGLPVDYAPDPTWRSSGTSFEPDPRLKGGKGSGLKRRRKQRAG